MKYFLLSFLLFAAGTVSADFTYRTPSVPGTYSSVSYTVNLDSIDIESQCATYPEFNYWTIQVPSGPISNKKIPYSQKEGTFLLYTDATAPVTQVVANCGTAEGSLANVDYNDGAELFNLVASYNQKTAINLILPALQTYGLAALGILGAIVVLMIGLLVFKYGKRLLFDQSITLGGYYLRRVPYKGYNRFRSQKWNSEHTM